MQQHQFHKFELRPVNGLTSLFITLLVNMTAGVQAYQSSVPSNWIQEFRRAQLLERDRKYDQAEAAYKSMMNTASTQGAEGPLVLQTLKHLSDFYRRRKDNAKAQKCLLTELSAVSKFGPTSPIRLHSLLGLADLASAQKDAKTARAYLVQAVPIMSEYGHRDYKTALLMLANIDASLGDYSEMDNYLSQLIEICKHPRRGTPDWSMLATAYELQTIHIPPGVKAVDIEARFREVLALKQSNPTLVSDSTVIRIQCGLARLVSDKKESIKLSQAAAARLSGLADTPEKPGLMLELAGAMAAAGKYEEAERFFQLALKIGALCDKKSQAEFINQLGFLARRNRSSYAQKFFDQAKALQKAPSKTNG